MWTFGGNIAGRILSWTTLAATGAGLVLCVIAIVQALHHHAAPAGRESLRHHHLHRRTVVLLALIIEWITRRRFALGVAPILGTLLIILARRFELGDAKDNMDPLVAVLIPTTGSPSTCSPSRSATPPGCSAPCSSFVYLLIRGLGLDG